VNVCMSLNVFRFRNESVITVQKVFLFALKKLQLCQILNGDD